VVDRIVLCGVGSEGKLSQQGLMIMNLVCLCAFQNAWVLGFHTPGRGMWAVDRAEKIARY